MFDTDLLRRVVGWLVRDGRPLPGKTPAALVSQLAHRVYGPLRLDRVRAMLDYHGLAGVPAENQTVVAGRHGISTRTLTNWSMALTAAGRLLPMSADGAAEAARRSRPDEDHLARARIARTLGLAIPQPAIAPYAPGRLSQADRAAAAIAVRVLASAGPLPLDALLSAVRRARRFDTLPVVTAEHLSMALTEAGASDDQGTWQAPDDANAAVRDRALISMIAGRKLARQEMIDTLVAAGYAATSARANKISTHPLIQRVGPDQYRVIGGSPS